jgi:hypothetical protein
MDISVTEATPVTPLVEKHLLGRTWVQDTGDLVIRAFYQGYVVVQCSASDIYTVHHIAALRTGHIE